jgi:hypothetical protein
MRTQKEAKKVEDSEADSAYGHHLERPVGNLPAVFDQKVNP